MTIDNHALFRLQAIRCDDRLDAPAFLIADDPIASSAVVATLTAVGHTPGSTLRLHILCIDDSHVDAMRESARSMDEPLSPLAAVIINGSHGDTIPPAILQCGNDAAMLIKKQRARPGINELAGEIAQHAAAQFGLACPSCSALLPFHPAVAHAATLTETWIYGARQ